MNFYKWMVSVAIGTMTLGATSCSKDDDVDMSPENIAQGTVLTNSKGEKINLTAWYGNRFSYDDEGRLVKAGDYSINWDKMTITLDDDYDEETFNFSVNGDMTLRSINYNVKDGQEEAKGSAEFSYNNGYLANIKCSYSDRYEEDGEIINESGTETYKLNWSNGNLISVECDDLYYEDGEKEEYHNTYIFEYGPNALINEFKQYTYQIVSRWEIMEEFAICGLLGKGPEYLPTLSKDVKYDDTRQLSYQLNQNGSIRTEKVSSYGTIQSIYYSYKDFVNNDAEKAPGRTANNKETRGSKAKMHLFRTSRHNK